MKRTLVRVLRAYQTIRDGEVVERRVGEQVEEEASLARSLVQWNKAELVERPAGSLTAAEAEAERAAKAKAAEELERRAQRGLEAEAATLEAPERAARAGRAGR